MCKMRGQHLRTRVRAGHSEAPRLDEDAEEDARKNRCASEIECYIEAPETQRQRCEESGQAEQHGHPSVEDRLKDYGFIHKNMQRLN